MSKKQIVIVGGGAGGLELIARLSKQFKKNPDIELTLIDSQLKHIWKPLFHEVAAGSFNDISGITDYLSYANQKNFKFQLGKIKSLDRENKIITLAKYFDQDFNLLLPERHIDYDILVFAIGSQVNSFNVPGVKENCLLIDDIHQAESFNKKFLNEIILKSQSDENLLEELNITIVGGGATGVELAAELDYVLSNIFSVKEKNRPYEITLVEAANRILSALPERLSKAVTNLLKEKGIKVLTSTQVTKVDKSSIETAKEEIIPSTLTVWVAGVKANEILSQLDGLEVNKLNQLMVNNKLQTTQDKNIFAIGDCACCLQVDKEGKTYPVPARAQAATQEAEVLAKSLKNFLNGEELLTFHYKDYGSLITVSNGTIGNLMARVAKNIHVEGWLARFFYWSLYKKHLYILYGLKHVILQTVSELVSSIHKPEIKLH
jgi:NADH dehydrogenase